MSVASPCKANKQVKENQTLLLNCALVVNLKQHVQAMLGEAGAAVSVITVITLITTFSRAGSVLSSVKSIDRRKNNMLSALYSVPLFIWRR